MAYAVVDVCEGRQIGTSRWIMRRRRFGEAEFDLDAAGQRSGDGLGCVVAT